MLWVLLRAETTLFPLDEVDLAVDRAKTLYQIAGVPDRFEHHYGAGGHRFYSDLMWPFIQRSRKGTEGRN